MTAAAIDPDAVTAKNAPVDASIMKEVEKAEKEQVPEASGCVPAIGMLLCAVPDHMGTGAG